MTFHLLHGSQIILWQLISFLHLFILLRLLGTVRVEANCLIIFIKKWLKIKIIDLYTALNDQFYFFPAKVWRHDESLQGATHLYKGLLTFISWHGSTIYSALFWSVFLVWTSYSATTCSFSLQSLREACFLNFHFHSIVDCCNKKSFREINKLDFGFYFNIKSGMILK